MKKYKITIITVVKNDEKNIEKTIRSVLSQRYNNIQYIVIDGNSTDKTLDIVKKFKNKIQIISRKDKNLWEAINLGLRKSKGEIIGILNSKDIFYKNALKTVNYYFRKHKIEFLFGAVKKDRIYYKFEPEKIFYRFNIYTSHSCGFFIRTKAQKKLGYYNTDYDYCSDYDLFYRMIVEKKMKGISTKKNEVIGKFDLNGISSRVPFYKQYYYEMKIRLDNGQNKIVVFTIFFLRLLRNFKRLFK